MTSSAAEGFTGLGRLLLTAASAVIVLAGLRVAAPVIGPVLIALIITIAWSPGSSWLRRRGWRPSIAALTGIVLGIAAIAMFVALVWSSLIQLQEKLPEYQPQIEALQAEIARMLSNLPIDSTRIFSSEVLRPSAIVGHSLKVIRDLTQTVGTLFIMVLLMAFMMLEATRFPEKLNEALGSSGTSSEKFSQFGARMRSYVGINAVFGMIAAVINTVVLLMLGVDFAILWGVLSFLLSFVPNIGFLIALVPPALLALVEYGFGRSIIVVGAYTVINTVVDNAIKPKFVGETLDLSPIVVVLSLLFWGWLLGPLGALVAVPLSIAAKFMLESFEESQWIARLMSDTGAKPVVGPRPPGVVNQVPFTTDDTR